MPTPPALGPRREAETHQALAVQIAEMATLVGHHAPDDGVHATAIERVSLIRASQTNEPLHAVHQPALCLIAQGSKRVMLRDEAYVYNPSRYLVVSVDLPITGQVIEASADAPYLCFRLDLDPALIAELILQSGAPPTAGRATPRGLFLGQSTGPLLDAMLRLMRLLAEPNDIDSLAPLAVREIHYRLLKSKEGEMLAQIAAGDGQASRIAKAIGWIKQRYAEPLRIDDLARAVHMSSSSLHHHFRAVTHMTPLQFQKQLRLQEARRLLFNEGADAATAGHTVGYESPSQFSREYSRLFGAPPARDLQRLKERAVEIEA